MCIRAARPWPIRGLGCAYGPVPCSPRAAASGVATKLAPTRVREEAEKSQWAVEEKWLRDIMAKEAVNPPDGARGDYEGYEKEPGREVA